MKPSVNLGNPYTGHSREIALQLDILHNTGKGACHLPSRYSNLFLDNDGQLHHPGCLAPVKKADYTDLPIAFRRKIKQLLTIPDQPKKSE